MAGAFLVRNLALAAAVTTTSTVPASLPLSNLRDPQPRMRARFAGGAARITLDLGQPAEVDCVALVSTTATAAATVRVALSAQDPTGALGEAWDTGTVPADTSPAAGGNVVLVAPLARLVDGRPPLTMDTTDVTMDATAWTMDATRQVWATLPAADAIALEDGAGDLLAETGLDALSVEAAAAAEPWLIETVGVPFGRYVWIELLDPGGPNVDIGIVAVGRLWRPGVPMLYGMREGRAIADRRDRNPFTGAEFPVPAVVNPRKIAFTLPFLFDPPTVAAHREMLDRLGGAGDALWIPETEDGLAERNRRSIWGAVAAPGEDAMLERNYFSRTQRAFTLTERP